MRFISEHILPGEAHSDDVLAGIPHGRASEALVPGCLVLEGGAFRGLYTQGFLDAMMENGLNLSCVVGVSAGALAGANYVSGQIGRSARTNLVYRHDSRYIGARSLLHSHSILDVGFLTEDRGVLEPLDRERFDRPEQRYVAVATDCETGEATYFEKGRCSDILLAARASATMPFLSPVVTIDGKPYLWTSRPASWRPPFGRIRPAPCAVPDIIPARPACPSTHRRRRTWSGRPGTRSGPRRPPPARARRPESSTAGPKP